MDSARFGRAVGKIVIVTIFLAILSGMALAVAGDAILRRIPIGAH